MNKKLIINKNSKETRVALLEDGSLVEFYIERGSDSVFLGNIYKGRVNRVLPGMQAAFVEIGLKKAAFLYVADIQDDSKFYELLSSNENGDEIDKGKTLPSFAIEDLLSEGQEIVVQVTKEPIGTKGARVSAQISLPGRYLVYIPESNHIGISRKIEDDKERERLKQIVLETKPPQGGFIVRTASSGIEIKEFTRDMEYLINMWEGIKEKGARARPPSIIHKDMDITLRVIRDILSPEIDEIIIDSEREYNEINSFIKKHFKTITSKVTLYTGQEPLFDHYGIEMEIDDMLREKVWLKSGGYIVIETTEALTAIDVNTGKYTGKKNLEETIIKTNMEAAREIAYQLRLRNIGGIIIIDFIDMFKQEDKDRVYNATVTALKKDRAITRVSEISELGLLEMTRKRMRNNIVKVMCTPCEYCEGKGYLKSKETITLDILRSIEKEVISNDCRTIEIQAHPEISDALLVDLADEISDIETRHQFTLSVRANPSLQLDDYHIH